MDKLLPALLILLSLGYIGINFVGLPPALVVENIILAAVYIAFAILLLYKPTKPAYVALVLVISFNAGRVSRTIWSPVEGFGRLAIEHVPLLLYLLAIATLALLKTIQFNKQIVR
ncbi:conserved hypothetical protein [Pyrobaculum islandicum DSM 4184]|uniref:Uncharacterized protein n=1 Tax=Pyrobaculum islandicum (strain DSM 4184 / JCM 9189 / GEO3) TaxID=384616 RepID=A1RUV6_PYRIL|nr:hypothetical protein [Pyrobaculum islandicum]ABL88738.1 conserved hypothetical protein [Pyrobaculum islandicum DSM 4184]